MIRFLFGVSLILPTILFFVQFSMFSPPETISTPDGLKFASREDKLQRHQEETEGAQAVRAEIARQAAAANYADSDWQTRGAQTMFLLCMRRPEGSAAPVPVAATSRQGKCQCVANAAQTAQSRNEMRYLVVTGLMIERAGLMRVRLPSADSMDSAILNAVNIDKRTARAAMSRMSASAGRC